MMSKIRHKIWSVGKGSSYRTIVLVVGEPLVKKNNTRMCIRILPDGHLECFALNMPVKGTGKASHGIYVESIENLGSVVSEEGSNWTDMEKLVLSVIEAELASTLREVDGDEVVLRRAVYALLNRGHVGTGGVGPPYPLILAHISSRGSQGW
ncbi:hypothetical protein BS47DRAFT_1000705 [Hydnum rufescens UP504]|uniref:Uncharacterized protein n=1 Tax=Hydnum rufescens UP504 TaxID=1448309 RepID=A0A9P6DYT6_9AGAM|nr:hypothetical protein BS47DRAFT_1000705 [Hydnum rufescens UP504]